MSDKLTEYFSDTAVKVIRYKTAESTNLSAIEYARTYAPTEPVVFIADEQTSGRGRLGRSFVSLRGGIYMSILTPMREGVDPTDLTVYAAVIASRALSELYSVDPKIKWVNDVYLGGRKLAGILVQGVVSPDGRLTHAVMGIGVNVEEREMPDEIKDIATSLAIEGVDADMDGLATEIAGRYIEGLDEAGSESIRQEYRRRSFIIGAPVNVITPIETYPARVIDISDSCELIVKLEGGEIRSLSSGDVSIRRL